MPLFNRTLKRPAVRSPNTNHLADKTKVNSSRLETSKTNKRLREEIGDLANIITKKKSQSNGVNKPQTREQQLKVQQQKERIRKALKKKKQNKNE